MKKIIKDKTHPTLLEELQHFTGDLIPVEIPSKKLTLLSRFSGKNNKNAWEKIDVMNTEEKKLHTLKIRALQNAQKILSHTLGESCEVKKKLSKRLRRKWNTEIADEVKDEYAFWMNRCSLFNETLWSHIKFRLSKGGTFKLGENYEILKYSPLKPFLEMISLTSLVLDTTR